MGKYYSAIHASGKRYSRAQAILEIREWDVFLSHRTKDDDLADIVAKCIQREGLTVFLDSEHLNPSQDGPEMGDTIKSCVGRSLSLVALLTDNTKESWWVPFEIGIATTMEKFLSTYTKYMLEANRPSYLEKWPQVSTHSQLHDWCSYLKQVKDTASPYLSGNILKSANVSSADYTSIMKSMTRIFNG